MEAKVIPYKQVLDFDMTCPFCKEPMVAIVPDAEKAGLSAVDMKILTIRDGLPSFHTCTCPAPRVFIIQDGIGTVPSFSSTDFTG